MKILLDTHAFLWWCLEPSRLPQSLIENLSDPRYEVYLSVASSWESQIKIGIGKLKLDDKIQNIIEKEIRVNQWKILPIQMHHTWALENLPPLHRDPFDRLLIAQALSENLMIATKDPLILSYPKVKTIWDSEKG